ncbi:sulfonate transport system permease protein [Pseudomonas taetrolens]|uniref:Sulfonate ABC transporter n=1 Tax=Pseudomonas taetrolens TaxID=47884 RepID=A0A0J6GK47_PSETA|nr:ABC transporter permease [Pseudomonas taetrolens]KMM82708.1 sulfonate ABC transporter [Pseudomonas taetrolens]SED19089.1 sulfonate transport system permease protein [Pseudomonas taetrolens]SQF88053.1 binding-protein dependent transport system inner membrane protein [Pseudomonas taetrolens]VEH51243.1 binding-protein dependent transport system inner membrane protein [Pseudomonas taetrolens]
MARAQTVTSEPYAVPALPRDNVKRLPPAPTRPVRKVEVARTTAWTTTLGDHALPWLLPLLLLGLWYIGVEHGWLSEQVLPPPAYVYQTLSDLITSGDLWLNASASLLRVVVGFALGACVGVALGLAMGLSKTVEDYLLPTFNALVQIPVLGWLPFALLLFGIGESLKYVLIAKAATVPITLCTLQAFHQAPKGLLEAGRAYGFSRWQSVLFIVLPSAVPTLFTGLRLGFTKAWLSLVVVELVASSEGLGYLIVYGRQLFQLDLVMAAVVVVGAIGLLIDRSFDYLERRLNRGRPTAAGRLS